MSTPDSCGNCSFYRRMRLHYAAPASERDEDGAVKGPLRCVRFPVHVDRESTDWCGEWRAADGTIVRVSGKPRAPVAPTKPVA